MPTFPRLRKQTHRHFLTTIRSRIITAPAGPVSPTRRCRENGITITDPGPGNKWGLDIPCFTYEEAKPVATRSGTRMGRIFPRAVAYPKAIKSMQLLGNTCATPVGLGHFLPSSHTFDRLSDRPTARGIFAPHPRP